MMVLRRDVSAVLGLLLLAPTADAFPITSPPTCSRRQSPMPMQQQQQQSSTSSTSLNNMLRDMADYNNPSWDPSFRSDRSGASSTNWRKNQGYNLSKPTPPELGGSYSSMRDAATNPYYDPGWAQSVRRDNPSSSQNFNGQSSYNGYNDPYGADRFGGSRSYHQPSTYPGMTSPRRTDKMYTNPTNPYYDPVWSQSYARNDEPIREGDHTSYYAPGYDRNSMNNYPYYGGEGGMMGGGGYYEDGMMGGGGGGGYGEGYGRGNGPGRRMYAVPVSPSSSNGGKKKAVLNGNSLMRTKESTLFQSNNQIRPNNKLSTALKMAYYDGPEFDGPPMFDGPMMPPPPGYGRGVRPGGRDYADGITTGTGGPYGANQMNPGMYRRGGGGGMRRGSPGPNAGVGPRGMGGGPMGQQSMGQRSMGGPGMRGGPGMGPGMGQQSMGGPGIRGGPDMRRGPGMGMDPFAGGPYGRGNPMAGMSLKDMAARTTTMPSNNAESISSMNQRPRAGFTGEPGAERQGATTTSSPTSTSSQYVPLSATYGRGDGGPVMDRNPVPLSARYGTRPGAGDSNPVMDKSPPLNTQGPPPPLPTPEPFIDSNVMNMNMGELGLPQTIMAARSVRPSVVLVTSKGVRKENSQGSGFVVAFDDSADDEDYEDDDFLKESVHILTSAHVAPPGWKVSVTFPGDPDKQYPATVVGRKLNSDLALLCVETEMDDDDVDYPFPPPLVLTAEDVSTATLSVNSNQVPTSEIGSPVYAFGYPMGVEGPTMTSGILSATTKGINYMDAPTGEESEISKSRPFEKTQFVITDAAMAGGMSGGPLVNNEGVVLGMNALVRSDFRALGNYAVSALECETFLERLEDKRSRDAGKEQRTKRVSSRTVNGNSNSNTSSEASAPSPIDSEPQQSAASEEDLGVAGYRVMLYGYSTEKSAATKILRRVAGLDEMRAENAMRSAQSFGAGVVDEFYVAESGNRGRAVKAAKKSADDLGEKLKTEGMMVEIEPLNLLT